MLAMMQVKNPVFPAKFLPENSDTTTKYAPTWTLWKGEYGKRIREAWTKTKQMMSLERKIQGGALSGTDLPSHSL